MSYGINPPRKSSSQSGPRLARPGSGDPASGPAPAKGKGRSRGVDGLTAQQVQKAKDAISANLASARPVTQSENEFLDDDCWALEGIPLPNRSRGFVLSEGYALVRNPTGQWFELKVPGAFDLGR